MQLDYISDYKHMFNISQEQPCNSLLYRDLLLLCHSMNVSLCSLVPIASKAYFWCMSCFVKKKKNSWPALYSISFMCDWYVFDYSSHPYGGTNWINLPTIVT